MGSRPSIVKNVAYNVFLQIATLLLPLVTVPYVSRILGSEGVGTYSYTYSIVNYFVVFGTLGLTLYGQRQIAYTRNDRTCMSETFCNLLVLRFLTLGAVILFYLFFFSVVSSAYHIYYIIQSIVILSNIFDISWLYIGLEDFKKTVTRTLLFKILSVILIFLCIKSSNDLWVYVMIQAGCPLFGNLTLWTFLPKTVQFIKPKWEIMKSYLWPSIQLFLPQVAIQIYVLFDKTMLGLMASSMDQVGYYQYAEQFVKVPLSIIGALSTVMFPRMSNYFSVGNLHKMKEYLNLSLNAVVFAAIPSAFGVAGIAKEFIPWMLGASFSPSIMLMIILAPLPVLIGLSGVIGNQMLIPSNRMKEYTISVVTGAAINFILNFFLISEYDAIGACIATIVAELSVTVVQLYSIRCDVDFKPFFKNMFRYLIIGCLMFLLVRVVGIWKGAGIVTSLMQIIVGTGFYMLAMWALKDPFMRTACDRIQRRIHHKI